MFDEIKKDPTRKPILTYFIAILSLIISGFTIISPELSYSIFGSPDGSVSVFKIFTLPFQHGFDRLSALAHLVFMLFFWISIGSFIEKVLGPERFVLLVTSTIAIYGITTFFLGLPGHGLSPLIFALIPVMVVAMLEAVEIKLAHAYSKVFKMYRNMMALFVLVCFVMLSILPIYFKYEANSDSRSSRVLDKSVSEERPVDVPKVKFTKKRLDNSELFGSVPKGMIFGNLINIVCLFVGAYFAFNYKKRIGGTLTRFNRRKHLSEKSYKPIYIFASAISVYLVFVLIITFFLEL